MGPHAPRQGRQPAQKSKPASFKAKSSPGKSKAKASKSTKPTASTSAAPLDVYSYSSSIKRPRGDVDPESRPQKAPLKSKSKGKGKAEDSDSESESDGSDGDEDALDMGGAKMEGLYMGGSDGGVRSEDDEEIDSDEAFEDEEDMPAKPNKGKGKARGRSDQPTDIDLDEDEVDMDDEDGEGYYDLAQVLDDGEYDSEDSDEDSDESNDSNEAMEDGDDSDDSEYAGALDKLSSFVEGLESKKRKISDEEEGGKKKKRVVLKERTEAYPEGEFVAVSAPDGTVQDKVNLDDLLASFAGSKNPRLAALRKSLKPLAAASAASTSKSTANSHLKAAGPLAAPLPARLQDKIEREVAYEKTKEETDKWNETVRRMKGESGLGVEGARHERLTLPLMGGAGDVTRDPNAAEWSAKFQPSNALEASIQSLLVAGQMQPHDLQKAEKAALASLDPADVAARQAELRQQRDLMFRAERKAKRVSKIKSKAFRRIHRRAKGKEGGPDLSIEDMAELDRIDGGDRVTEEKARMEIARARERVTLKHSTKGGRWSKSVGGIEGLDEERNTAVREMVARGEQLRKRIAGAESGDEPDEFDDSGSEEEDAEDADFDRIRGTAFDELASLDAKDAAAAANGPKLKGVLNMKFMKDAIARGERKTQGEADDLRRRLELMDEAADREDEEDSGDDQPTGMSAQVQGNLGRMVFGPSGAAQPPPPPVATNSKSTQHTTKLNGPLAITSASSLRQSPLTLSDSAARVEENPWLAVDDSQPSSGKVSRKMNKATVGKDSRDASRSAAKVDRHKSKLSDAREAEKDDAQVEIDPEVVLALANAPSAPQLTTGARMTSGGGKKVSAVAVRGDDDDSSDEDDEEQHDAQRGRGPAAFKQRELVAKAFAGDDVVADFEAEKRREIERDAPKEEDNTLPGWGAWSGKGVKKARNAKKFITKIPGIEPEQRKDASYSNVIISEKKDKKAAKYLLKDLPFPYTSAAQHDHKLRTPLGGEWSTSTVLRDQTMPRVLIKPGVTIRPVDKKI
ncbi:U3 small nucleolar RNA-associated protein 14, partial [Phenoliferia sp. Uapishka_3]